MIGRSNARRGARRIFAVLQNRRLNQHLLYTIVDVPLPIPTLPGAASPPLTLPYYRKPAEATHQDVSEEGVAAALGYAAQVVRLIGEYLGQGLMYPVTCVGSRSLIRDGISAMVGPRM